MPIPKTYPKAKLRMLGMAPGAWSGRGNQKLVIHTTETEGVPDYDPDNDAITGELAPHITYVPATRSFVQDYFFDRPSESLRVYDNDSVFQLEIVCYSAKSIADKKSTRIWVGDLKDEHYQDIAEFTRWLMQYTSIKPEWPGKRALSYSVANASGFRMNNSDFHRFNGILGHQHVPLNTHWDPGAFNWEKYLSYVNKEDDVALSAAEQQALTWLVTALGSDPEDLPRWGRTAWNAYKEEWTSGPGPGDPVTHNQLGHIYYRLRVKIEALQRIVEGIESASGLTEAEVKDLVKNTKLTP